MEADKAKIEAELTNPEVYTDKVKFKQAEEKYKACVETLSKVQQEYDVVFEKMLGLEEG